MMGWKTARVIWRRRDEIGPPEDWYWILLESVVQNQANTAGSEVNLSTEADLHLRSPPQRVQQPPALHYAPVKVRLLDLPRLVAGGIVVRNIGPLPGHLPHDIQSPRLRRLLDSRHSLIG